MTLAIGLIGLGCALLGVAACLYTRMSSSGDPHSIESTADYDSTVTAHSQD